MIFLLVKWHDEDSIKDGLLTHLANSKAWKHFDFLYPNFFVDPRNVYLALAFNGFKPFKAMNIAHST